MLTGIYKITNPIGRIYIGQSINIEQRFVAYKSINKSKRITKLFRSFLKYGISAHDFEIIELCEPHELNIRERFWQEHYDVLVSGLNCFLTKTDAKRRRSSDESRKINSEAQIKKYKSGYVHPWIGKRHSEETKLKISISHIGKKKPYKPQPKKAGYIGPMKGRFSGAHPRITPILQFDLDGNLIKEWVCGMDIKRAGYNNANISSACKGLLKTSAGFKWRYKNKILSEIF